MKHSSYHAQFTVPVRFERRRYGRQMYTWAYALIDGHDVSLGDPWPCTMPKASEIETAISEAIAGAKL